MKVYGTTDTWKGIPVYWEPITKKYYAYVDGKPIFITVEQMYELRKRGQDDRASENNP